MSEIKIKPTEDAQRIMKSLEYSLENADWLSIYAHGKRLMQLAEREARAKFEAVFGKIDGNDFR